MRLTSELWLPRPRDEVFQFTHTFAEERGGTLVGDEVEFEVPLERLVGWYVMRDVRKIFAFRRQALLTRFAQPP